MGVQVLALPGSARRLAGGDPTRAQLLDERELAIPARFRITRLLHLLDQQAYWTPDSDVNGFVRHDYLPVVVRPHNDHGGLPRNPLDARLQPLGFRILPMCPGAGR